MKIFVFFLTLLCGAFAADLNGWHKLYEKDGLSFYSKQIKGSSLLNFRAIGIIKTKMEEALAILRNVEHAQKWDDNTKLKKTVEDISDIEAITYSETNIPWPFRNRDLVLNNKLYIDRERVALRVDVNSIERKDYPKRKKLVRAHLNAKMFFRPMDENTSQVDLMIMVDPRGSIPHWVVNMVQKSMPYDFLKGIENYAKKVEMKPNKGVQDLYDELITLLNELKAAGKGVPEF